MNNNKILKVFLMYLIFMFTFNVNVYAEEDHIHDWSSWIQEEVPGCGSEGEEYRYCYTCGKKEYQAIPATGEHRWDNWETVKPATIYQEGIAERECWYCGTVEKKQLKKLTPYVKLSKNSLKLSTGKTYKLKVGFKKGDKVKQWKSSNTKVASVNSKGIIRALKAGSCKITVYMKSGKKADCVVTVEPKKKPTKISEVTSQTGIVYWVPGGSVYHRTRSCRTLSRSRTIYSGSLSECPKPRPCKVCY